MVEAVSMYIYLYINGGPISKHVTCCVCFCVSPLPPPFSLRIPFPLSSQTIRTFYLCSSCVIWAHTLALIVLRYCVIVCRRLYRIYVRTNEQMQWDLCVCVCVYDVVKAMQNGVEPLRALNIRIFQIYIYIQKRRLDSHVTNRHTKNKNNKTYNIHKHNKATNSVNWMMMLWWLWWWWYWMDDGFCVYSWIDGLMIGSTIYMYGTIRFRAEFGFCANREGLGGGKLFWSLCVQHNNNINILCPFEHHTRGCFACRRMMAMMMMMILDAKVFSCLKRDLPFSIVSKT